MSINKRRIEHTKNDGKENHRINNDAWFYQVLLKFLLLEFLFPKNKLEGWDK
jgi:hypothetical protein